MSSKEMLTNHSKFFFFFNDTATTEIYTLSLHDALPISITAIATWPFISCSTWRKNCLVCRWKIFRSEEHTSELQSDSDLVCRLLLDKKRASVNTAHDAIDLAAEDAQFCWQRNVVAHDAH